MTGNAIDAKSEARDVHQLSSQELDAVSGGGLLSLLKGAVEAAGEPKQGDALKAFNQLLQQLP